jgi:hypothetical protein
MDLFFFQLAIIFLPGLLWERIVATHALKTPPTQFEIGLRTFTFGLASYVIAYAIYAALGAEFLIPQVKREETFIADARYVGEFLTATVVAIVGSLIWLYGLQFKLVSRFLRCIGATKKYGNEDLWDFVFNAPEGRVEYVYVRDYANQKIFSGWVRGFSEPSEKMRELLLRDVQVFNLESKLLYETPLMYIARPIDDIHIEFPAE